MLLNTIVKTVKRKAHRGSQTVTTDLITTDIIACINEAIRDISKHLPKKFWHKIGTDIAVTTGVVGTPAVYSLASDVHELSILHYTNSNSLVKLGKVDSDKEWFDHVWGPNAALDLPRVYREIGPNSTTGYKQIELFPVPSQNVTLSNEYYRTKGSDLSTTDLSTEIPTIPDWCQDAVEKGALYYFLKGFDDPGQMVALADYQASIKSMNEDDESDLDTDLRLRWDIKQQSSQSFRLS